MVDLAVPPSQSWARRRLNPAVAELLARARLDLRLTVAEAAAGVGISPRYLRQLEHGERVPSTAVADLLELDGDDAAALRSVALADVGRAYRTGKMPQQPVVRDECVDSAEVRLFPEPEPLPPGIVSRIVRPSPYV